MLDAYIFNPSQPPQLSVIFFHGLGADNHDLQPIISYLNIPEHLPVRFVIPNAPVRPISIYMGHPMRAWYDFLKEGWDHKVEDRKGLEKSGKLVEELIQREIDHGLSHQQIVLAGFSQGGALSLFVGLRYPETLAGLIVLSAYLPLADSTVAERHPANQHSPVLFMHGYQDAVIPFSMAQKSRHQLSQLGYRVEEKNYNMAHAVCPDQIGDIGRWISERCLTAESKSVE